VRSLVSYVHFAPHFISWAPAGGLFAGADPARRGFGSEQAVAQVFLDLNRINGLITLQVQRAGEECNRALLMQLEEARSRLGQQLPGSAVAHAGRLAGRHVYGTSPC